MGRRDKSTAEQVKLMTTTAMIISVVLTESSDRIRASARNTRVTRHNSIVVFLLMTMLRVLLVMCLFGSLGHFVIVLGPPNPVYWSTTVVPHPINDPLLVGIYEYLLVS